MKKGDPGWEPDSQRACCALCSDAFAFCKRRHHCRFCGKIVCANCSKCRRLTDDAALRCCDACMDDDLVNHLEGIMHVSAPTWTTELKDGQAVNRGEQTRLYRDRLCDHAASAVGKEDALRTLRAIAADVSWFSMSPLEKSALQAKGEEAYAQTPRGQWDHYVSLHTAWKRSSTQSSLQEDPACWPVNLFHSAEEYWQGRSSVAAFQIEMVPYCDGWPLAFQEYRELFVQSVTADADSSRAGKRCPFERSHIFHIGSTSIVGCPAKPVIDMMIVTANGADFRSCVLQAWTAASRCPDLNFDTGFIDEEKEWAMFQIVKATADGRPGVGRPDGMAFELNVHLYPAPCGESEDGKDISRAQEKLELVAYLRDASAWQHLDEYVNVKMALSQKVESGEMDSAGYSNAKNAIVGKVLSAAREWVSDKQLDMQQLMALMSH